MKKQLLLLVMMLLPMVASADAVEIDGIYYNLSLENKTAEVTWNPNKYSGNVVIPESIIYDGVNYTVTSVGGFSFQSCRNLSSITIPQSVTKIGHYAFNRCSALTSVTVPNSVTSLGNSVFEECTGLTSITLSNSVATMGQAVFSSCTSLTSIAIPNSVTTIDLSTFEGCTSLTSVTIGNGVKSIEEKAFNKCSSLISISIPNSVTSIGDYSFTDCTALTSLTIGDGVSYISQSAFAHCTKLATVKLGNGLKVIGPNAFNGCGELFSINIPNGVTSIGYMGFNGCSSLTEITLPESMSSLSDYVFRECNSLEKVTVYAPSMTSYGGSGVFGSNFKGIIYVPQNSISIYKKAWSPYSSRIFYIGENTGSCGEKVTYSFEESTGLLTISGEGEMYDFDGYIQIPWKSFSTSVKKVVLEDGVTYIGKASFSECTNLTDITIPNSVINVGYGAFSGTSWFEGQPEGVVYVGKVAYVYKGTAPENTEVVIKDGTISIARSAFSYCSGLTSIVFPKSLKRIGDDAFWDCTGLSSINIPYTVEFIGNWAFRGCRNLTSIKISDGVTTIGSGAFEYCSSLPSIAIPYSVTAINAATFEGCTSLTSVTIPNSVTIIGKSAFSGCTSLASITIPSSVTKINDEAFSGCTSFTSVTIPNSITYLSSSIFRGCTGLTSVTIPNSVTGIGSSVFKGCTGLTSITIPNTVEGIGGSAFQSCKALTSVSLPNSLTIIDIGIFKDCTSLTTLNIPNSVTTISSSAFEGCTGLTSIAIPDGVKDIGNSAFANCSSLTSISLPNSVNSISYGVFSGCTDLTTATLGNSVTSIGNYLFQGCSNLSSIVIPSSVTSIANNVFDGCKSLNSIVVDKDNTTFDSRENCNAIINTSTNDLLYGCNNTIIPNGVLSIRNNAFNCFDGLKTLTIPASVTSINDNAFPGLTGLTSISVNENNTKYDSRDNCNAIIETATNRLLLACNTTTIPSTVTSFKSGVFKNCVTVSLPEGIEKIDGVMFRECGKLETLSIPKSVSKIAQSAFDGCSSLKTVIFKDGSDLLEFEVSYPSYYSNPTWFVTCPLDSIFIGREIKYDYTVNNLTYYKSPFRDNKTLRKVVYGENVKTIPTNMYTGCSNLTSVKTQKNIIEIGEYAFNKCDSLADIIIPENVKSIGYSAFNGCKNLQTVTIPKTITAIADYTFQDCGLTSITIPDNIQSIGQRAFWGCTQLTNLRIEDGTTSLSIVRGDYAAFYANPITNFYLGRNLSSYYPLFYSSVITTPFNLTVGKSVNSLRGGLFYGLKIKTLAFEEGPDTLYFSYEALSNPPFEKTTIDSIYLGRTIVCKDDRYSRSFAPFVGSPFPMRIGNNIEEIGDNSYSGWAVDTLYIPKNVKKIGSSPFNGCAYLHDIFIEDGDETLEFSEGIGFYGIQLNNLYLGRNVSYLENKSPFSRNKEALKNLTIGNHVTDIGDGQFTGCKNLTQLNFPESLKRIGKQAFYGCTGLTTLDIPSNIVEVKKDAFNLCTGLTSVVIEDSEETLTIDNNFMNGELKKVYLGRNINYPEGFAPFSGLDYLDSLTIGSKVSTIGKSAFAACPKLKDVVSYAEIVPTTNEYAFSNSYLPNATLRVPYKLYDQYRVTTPWSLFGHIKNFEGLYNLIYLVDGEEYKKSVVEQGTSITAEAEPTKEGYSFSGWSDIPKIMPEHDVTVTGTFSINSYKLTYMIDDKVYKETMYEYGATITPEPQPEGDYHTFEWTDLPATMPAHDVVVYATYTSGIAEVLMDTQRKARIYSPNGKKLDKPQKGLNIVIFNDGTVKKMVVK